MQSGGSEMTGTLVDLINNWEGNAIMVILEGKGGSQTWTNYNYQFENDPYKNRIEKL